MIEVVTAETGVGVELEEEVVVIEEVLLVRRVIHERIVRARLRKRRRSIPKLPGHRKGRSGGVTKGENECATPRDSVGGDVEGTRGAVVREVKVPSSDAHGTADAGITGNDDGVRA